MVVRDAKRAAILFLRAGVGPFGPVECGITKKEKTSYQSLLLVGEMWVSNPRPSEPQSDALTS